MENEEQTLTLDLAEAIEKLAAAVSEVGRNVIQLKERVAQLERFQIETDKAVGDSLIALKGHMDELKAKVRERQRPKQDPSSGLLN
jgi:hypothetical protein